MQFEQNELDDEDWLMRAAFALSLGAVFVAICVIIIVAIQLIAR